MVLLAGLDHIDNVFTDFVGALENITRNGKDCKARLAHWEYRADWVVETRYKAIEVLLAVTAGAYQTTLLTYLIQRDLFPSVMKVRVVSEETRHGADMRPVYPRLRIIQPSPRTVYPTRPTSQLQQIRVPKSLPATAKRLCQRVGHSEDCHLHRAVVPDGAVSIHQDPG